MLQRLIEAVQAGPAQLRHLRLDGNPLLHGFRGEVAVGARVSVVRKVGDGASAAADAEGTVVEMELEGPNRCVKIRYPERLARAKQMSGLITRRYQDR
jgi:hypothetical protein